MNPDSKILPLVTVAIPIYNSALHLEECLNCIESQTYRNLEIICIDDCSTDNSVDILRRHAAKDSRYRIIVKEENAGIADSRNISIAEAKGEYFYFCDSDDICDSEMLEIAVAKAEGEHTDLVIWDYYEFGEPIYKLIDRNQPCVFTENVTKKQLVHFGCFLWTHLFRTSSLKALNMPFPLGRTKHDLPLHWAACICFDKIVYMPKRLYGYRIGGQQTSRKKGRVLLDFIYVHDYLKEYLEKNGQFDAYSVDYYQSLANAMCSVVATISSEYRNEAREECRRHLCPEMDAAVKNMSYNVRLFISSLRGNPLAGMSLVVLQTLQTLYRKIKH